MDCRPATPWIAQGQFHPTPAHPRVARVDALLADLRKIGDAELRVRLAADRIDGKVQAYELVYGPQIEKRPPVDE